MAARQWTTEQKQCIEADGGPLLVSAAAGSGKTAVLVQRILHKITREENPVSIDRLLVVTFTKAAAAEMKQRIAAELSRRMGEHPGDRRLRRQQGLLPRAAISTVDSFCANLVREHFHLLDISPQFRVAEDAETRLLRDEAVGEIIEEAYAQAEPGFLELADMLGNGKNDRRLAEDIEKIYDFIQSHADPEGWLDEKEQAYATAGPLRSTVWADVVLRHIAGVLRHAQALLASAISLTDGNAVLTEKYRPALAADRQAADEALARLLSPECDWDTLPLFLSGIGSAPLKAARACGDEAAKERVKALRGDVKALIRPLPALLCGNEAQCREDLDVLRRLVVALFALVRRFAARYEEKKKNRRMLDFSDLEHGALRLLTSRGEDGAVLPSPLAQELSVRFDEILVDEYQDTNAAQDALFYALSREGENLFFVGDVKQSIYGFRQAMPELFLRKRDAWPDYTGESYPATITLGHNFRSRAEVTDSVNFVFRQLMTKESAGIAYGAREALVPRAPYPGGTGYETELILIDTDSNEDPLDGRDAGEARVIAKRIGELVGTLPVTENGVTRPAAYGDFCILLRSKKGRSDIYAAELTKAGVPVTTAGDRGFFATPEISLALSLLRVIDNPLLDVPLLAVLLSPLYGFTPDDLAGIRLLDRRSALYPALSRMAGRGTTRENRDLPERCRDFIRQMTLYRTLAATLPIDRLLTRLFEETGLPAVMRVRRGGEQKLANLRLLQEHARRFEQNGFRGLTAFIRYLDRMEEQQLDLPPAALSGHPDTVQILSIHHSKGLEYPVVFLAGLGNMFNSASTRDDLLLHPTLGVGMMRRDPNTYNRFDTLPRRAVSLSIRQSERAEELRVLYVAMTRAREKLILTMSLKHPDARLASLASGLNGEESLPAHTVWNAGSLGDWLLTAALRHPSAVLLRQMAGVDSLSVLPCETAWHVDCVSVPRPDDEAPPPASTAAADPRLAAHIRGRIAYRYPYLALSALPVKLAASDMAHATLKRESVARSRPAFLGKAGLTPAERGTALHTFMQYARYEAAAADPEEEARRLVCDGFLTQQQGASLDFAKIRRFFSGPLYERIRHSPRCMRELPFTVERPAQRFSPGLPAADSPQDRITIQGIADCVFEENGALVIVDYKTDRIKTAGELAERYTGQLHLYAEAFASTLELPIADCLLYSFQLGVTVSVGLPRNSQ